MPIIAIILLLLGIGFLIKGSGIFVGSSSQIAKKFGVSEFIIGLTLVALGTSLPELTSSIIASIKNESGLILGTIIGANIANLTLIIGLSAIFSKIKIKKEVLKRDGYILVLVFSLLVLFLMDGFLSRIEGIVFLMLYLSYTLFLIESKFDLNKSYNFSDFAKYFFKFGYLNYLRRGIFLKTSRRSKGKKIDKKHLSKHFLFLALGLIIVFFSAELVVSNAIYLAEYYLIAPLLVGILISIGTTLPELSVAITASKSNHAHVSIGNAIGSSITNTLLVLGLAAVIHPLSAVKENLFAIFPFLAISTFFVLIFIKTDLKISKKEGFFLIALYLSFLIKMIFL